MSKDMPSKTSICFRQLASKEVLFTQHLAIASSLANEFQSHPQQNKIAVINLQLEGSKESLEEKQFVALMGIDWRKLKILSVRAFCFTRSTVEAIAKAAMPLLVDLVLNGFFSAESFSIVMKAGLKFSYLNLNKSVLADKCLAKIQKIAWRNLKRLSLQKNSIANQGVKHLAAILMPELESLDMSSNFFTDCAGKPFAKANWPHLNFICFHNNIIGQDFLRQFIRISGKQLMYIRYGQAQNNTIEKLYLIDSSCLKLMSKMNNVEEIKVIYVSLLENWQPLSEQPRIVNNRMLSMLKYIINLPNNF